MVEKSCNYHNIASKLMGDHRIAPLYIVLDSRQCKYSALNMGQLTAKFTFTLILWAVFST